MDVAITIVMLVPVLLAVALIISVIRKNITERQAGDPVDISGAIPAVIVLMVAVLIITAMGNAASPYVWDEDSGELTVKSDVSELNVQPWDSYASQVKSLVIADGVTIGSGAFDSLTKLEYLDIGQGAQIAQGAFSGTFLGPDGSSSVTVSEGMEFLGSGTNTLYYCDPSIYAFNGTQITGLATGASPAVLAIPSHSGSSSITAIAEGAFRNNTSATTVFFNPNVDAGPSSFREMTGLTYVKLADVNFGANIFRGCTSLTSVVFYEGIKEIVPSMFAICSSLDIQIPDTVTKIGSSAFNGAGLTSVSLPNATEIGSSAFYGITSVTSLSIPKAITIGGAAFIQCHMTEVSLPSTLQTIGENAFKQCNSVTSVTFEAGFSADLTSGAPNWTFYATDGTTTLDKAVPANFAGKTFQGTYSALIEVAPGQTDLTPQQIEQVHLHTQELQQQDLDIQPLPFQPSFPTQEEEPVSA